MKYCTNCGTQLSDDAKFCSVCGTKQVVPNTPASEPAPPKKTAAPKRPAAPPKQAAQTNTQARKADGPKEDYFSASETAGEVVLSSWEAPKPKPETSANANHQSYTDTYRDNTRQQQQYYQQQAAPPRQQQTVPPRQQAAPPRQQQVAPPQKKKRGFFSWLLIILMILIVLYFLGSILGGCKNVNLPPDPGTPEPAAHEGVFVCGSDTLFFNGDGKTLSWHFASEDSCSVPDNAKQLGPQQGSGTYTFLFSHGKARYDVAENLYIHVDSVNRTTLMLAGPASDTLISFVGDNGTVVRFQKLKPVPGN